MLHFWKLAIFAIGFVTAGLPAPEDEIRLPIHAAYSEPNPNALQPNRDGVAWKSTTQNLVWYGTASGPVDIDVELELRLPEGDRAQIKLVCANRTMNLEARGKGSDPVRVNFETYHILEAGPIRLELTLQGFSGAPPTILALIVHAKDPEKLRFTTSERRNAASVHLGYPLKPGEEMSALYQEMTGVTDPLYTYYMACGWRRGYFGMQVNSPTERRILFSVWDSGNEGVDRQKVDADNRVQLVEAGEGVTARGFGNEGTGGQSYLKFNWKIGVAYRFLVTAKAEGDKTVYSGFFFAPEVKRWRLIARFRAPKDGKLLNGLYSFSENFVGVNGQGVRKARFGNGWVKGQAGWRELTTAKFTHDSHGRKERWDYAGGVEDGSFFLSHGGFGAQGSRYGDKITRTARSKRPTDIDSLLPLTGANVFELDNDQDGHGPGVDFNQPIADEDLIPLKSIPKLVGLRILQGEVSDVGLNHLEGFQLLRTLVIRSTRITDAGLASICKLKGLVKLDLMKTRLSAKGLVHLKKLPSLKRLYLYGADLKGGDISPLESLRQLDTLDLPSTISDGVLRRLKERLPNTDVRRI
jgi:hypothetical protein